MINKKTSAAIFCMLVVSLHDSPLTAQTTFHQLEDAWQYADAHNISIALGNLDAGKNADLVKQSYGALLPQVGTNAGFTENTSLQTTLLPGIILGKPEGTYVPVQFGQKYIYTAGVTAQMDILNLQTWFNIQATKAANEASKDARANARKTVYLQVASQYYAYLLNKEAAELSAQSATLADSVYQLMNDKFAVGTANQGNVDVAKLSLERAQQTLITAQYQAQTSLNNLKSLLNMSVNDSLLITTDISEATQPPTDAVFTEDPSIRQAFHTWQQGIAQYRTSNSAFLPTLSVLYSSTKQQNDNKFEPFQGGPTWYKASYWSLQASWKIFSGGSRFYQSRVNKINATEKQLQYDNTIKQASINDENLRLNYRKTLAVTAKAKDVMQLSLDNYVHVSYRYSEGLSSIEDRLTAFTDYINYQNSYLNALSDMLIQLYQVKIRQHTF